MGEHLDITMMHTPGHTPGSCSYRLRDGIVTGDTLFVNGCGRCDFVGGDPETMFATLKALIDKLPGQTIMYPGHDYGPSPSRPSTSSCGQPVPAPHDPRRVCRASHGGQDAQHRAARRPARLDALTGAIGRRRRSAGGSAGLGTWTGSASGSASASGWPVSGSLGLAMYSVGISPVIESRNASMLAMSSGVNGAGALGLMFDHLGDHVGQRDDDPSCRYGPVLATLRRVGTLNTKRSRSSWVTSKRPLSRSPGHGFSVPSFWYIAPPKSNPLWQLWQSVSRNSCKPARASAESAGRRRQPRVDSARGSVSLRSNAPIALAMLSKLTGSSASG